MHAFEAVHTDQVGETDPAALEILSQARVLQFEAQSGLQSVVEAFHWAFHALVLLLGAQYLQNKASFALVHSAHRLAC